MAETNGENKPRGNHLRWLVIGAAAATIIVGTAFIILLIRWPFSRARVAQSLTSTISGSVTFAKLHPTFIPFPGCVAEGVVFRRTSSAPGTPPFVTIQRMAIQTRYADLFFRPGYIVRIVLNGLYVRIPPRRAGKKKQSQASPSNIRVGEIVANGATLEIARADGKPPLKFEFHSLSVHSVSAHIVMTYRVAMTNALPPGEILSTGRFGPWHIGDFRQTPVSGTASFSHANLGAFHGIAGTLSSEQKFAGTIGRIDVTGKLDIPDFKLTKTDNHAELSSQFHLLVNATNGDVILRHVNTSLLQTNIIARGSIVGTPGKKGKTTSIALTIARGRIQDVLHLFVTAAHPPMDGLGSFQAHVTVAPLGKPFLQEVMAQADFQVRNGRFEKPSTQASVNQLSSRARGLKKKDADPPNAIADLKGHVVLRHGSAKFTQIVFVVPGAVARMKGTFNLLNDRLNFQGTLKTDAKFSQAAGGGIKSVLLKPLDPLFKKKNTGAVIPVYMSGTYDHPRFGVNLLKTHQQAK
ncbi:MAG TPA: AsmA-like C-terminal region-containing protein [Candidatus Acidoferrales bacterium]|nr:AsmA-like C-terminal region-containing protein [Candidatus Acidoferrales bacterium]